MNWTDSRHGENPFCFYKILGYFYSKKIPFACGKSFIDGIEKQEGSFYFHALLNP